ncbi:hypothetical protein FRC12_022961 [Ceratobasidium sp. 428]|nr:hypothetical protein FRC12_022961 [Ceratobasidium sp. 428]
MISLRPNANFLPYLASSHKAHNPGQYKPGGRVSHTVVEQTSMVPDNTGNQLELPSMPNHLHQGNRREIDNKAETEN